MRQGARANGRWDFYKGRDQWKGNFIEQPWDCKPQKNKKKLMVRHWVSLSLSHWWLLLAMSTEFLKKDAGRYKDNEAKKIYNFYKTEALKISLQNTRKLLTKFKAWTLEGLEMITVLERVI